MNRIDRLFAITTRLRARGYLRAADLADIFEVSTRTIYRDMAALSESGVPIVSLPGRGYSLVDGYFDPLDSGSNCASPRGAIVGRSRNRRNRQCGRRSGHQTPRRHQ
jgi:hypothetical protein